MTTIERMLAILGDGLDNWSARERGALLTAASAHRGRRSRFRSSSRRARAGNEKSAVERLEQRQVLAVSTFASLANGGLVTVVAEGGDNVYIQQVASAPQSLYVADNSSFQNRTVVGGPDITLSPEGNPAGVVGQQYLKTIDFSSFDRILITTGQERVETVPQAAQGYPMVSPGVTRFTLSAGFMHIGGIPFLPSGLSGRFSLPQSDGSVSTWSFDNFGVGQPSLTSGLGVTQSASPGDLYPVSISAFVGDSGSKAGVDIQWNVPALSRIPTLDSVDWYSQQIGFVTDRNVLPAAPASAFISLPNSSGPGLNPIIPSSFLGRITVDGTSFAVSSDRNGILSFADPQAPITYTPSATFSPLGDGFFTPRSVGSISGRVVTGADRDPLTGEYPRGLFITLSGPYSLSLDAARYAVATGGKPVSATVFAGQDITAALDVNLLSPGSSIQIDSPVPVLSTRSAPGVSLRASTVEVNARLSVDKGRLNVGPAISNPQAGYEIGRPVAEVVGGKVSRIVVPVGFGGSGYDAANPPRVTIDSPQSVTATAVVAGVVKGVVTGFNVESPGSGYTTPPTLIIDPPNEPGGVSAKGTAVAGGPSNGILSVNLVDAGSGYTRAPQVRLQGTVGTGARISTTIAGSLATSVVAVTNGGFGYVPNSTLPLSITGLGRGAAGVATVDGNGKVVSITITAGGSGYTPATTKVEIPAPPPSTGETATAVAVIDPATTRIAFVNVKTPGSGYGRIPSVSIAPPLAVSSAGRVVTTVENGTVKGVGFIAGSGLRLTVQSVSGLGGVRAAFVGFGAGGQGYAVNDIVTMNSAGAGTGRSAQFKVLEVSATGAVQRVGVVAAGVGFAVAEEVAHDGAPSRGRGYTAPPKVFIARPDSAAGRQATAESLIDSSGSLTGFKIIDPGSGYSVAPLVEVAGLSPLAIAESLSFNASTQASVFDISLGDDPFTSDERSRLFVSQSGSLSAVGIGSDVSLADSVRIEVHQGDIVLEGSVSAKAQSYLMRSGLRDQQLAPFRFTTAGDAVIRGGDLAITLANDLPTPLVDGAVAFNEVTLHTNVDSLRVRAARTDGKPVVTPFPYALTITEDTGLNVDAVAGSSFPITLSSGSGVVNFNAALTTAGGLVITGNGVLTTAAPIATTRGPISLYARELQVNSSLRVTDEPVDAAREDIVLDATSGAITLRGGSLEAPGRVRVRQKSGKVPATKTYNSIGSTSLVSGQTVSLPLSISDTFSFDDLSVKISLAVTDPSFSLQDLSASLVAPNGARYGLFNRFDFSNSKTATDTVFSPLATTPIFFGKEPFTGKFRPSSGDALTGLYNRIPASGVWRLEVTTRPQFSFFGSPQPAVTVGSISGLSLALQDPVGGTNGDVLGTSRIIANSLLLDAEGSVGNPSQQPNGNEFYLKTDVDTVEAAALGSFSLADAGNVEITGLRAGGLVSLRADGVDRADGSPALKASLSDVPAIDVSAPAGSIDVQVTTGRELEVGNAKNLSLLAPFRTGLSPMRAAGNVTIRTIGGSQGGDIFVLDGPLAGSSSRTVRVASTTRLAGVYSPGVPGLFVGRITARTNGSISSLFPGVSQIATGDRILVTAGADMGGDNANGIYVVKRVGGPTTTWQLDRASDADTLGELPTRTFVRPIEGAESGKMFQVTHGIVATSRFGSDPIAVSPVTVSTNIGSDDVDDMVTFVVSTTDGTNTSPGSLGKMIQLRQQNDTSQSENPSQNMALRFANYITAPIVLSQELPLIEKAFAIDGKARYPQGAVAQAVTIDGSRIITTRANRSVAGATAVDGIVFAPSSGAAVSGSGASIANVIVGGFARGAAIKVDGAPNVVIDKVNVGVDSDGNRFSNSKGVVVTASSGTGTAGVTISNSIIGGGAVAGVSLEGTAAGVKIYGTKIGAKNAANTLGIAVTASGANAVGDVALGRNFISFNGTGMRFTAGSVTVLNTDVVDNAANGIDISGGSHVVGRNPRDAFANKILGNGGFGISLTTSAVAATQQVRGNLLGVGVVNTKGNVGVGGKAADATLGYVPSSATGVDRFDNLHAVAAPPSGGGTGGGGGGVPKPPPKPTTTRVPFAWRPRQR